MNTLKAEVVTRKHMQRVSELCGQAAIEMIQRGAKHDQSKLEPVELEPLQRMQDLIDSEGQAEYGSAEYKRRTDMLGAMTEHHYKNNAHHPQHYENGVDGMNLFDVLEMFLDWKAASERGEASTMNVAASVERFKITPQLQSVILNTVDYLGWKP